jgi:hypothetical protein
VAHLRVRPGHPSRGDRIAGGGPAVHVDAQTGPDPLPERVAPGGRLRGQVRLEQVPNGDPLGGEHAPGWLVVEPELRDVGRLETGAAPLQQRDPEHREVEVVVLGDPVDRLGEARGAARAVPGPARRDLVGQTHGGEPGGHRPVPRRLSDRADALSRQALDGLAEHASGGSPEPGAANAVGKVTTRRSRRDGVGLRQHLVDVVRLDRGQRPGQRAELVEQLERERAQLGARRVG